MDDHRRQLARLWRRVCGQPHPYPAAPIAPATVTGGPIPDGDRVPMDGYGRWADLIDRPGPAR